MALPFPPNLLKTGVGPSVVQSCHSLSLLLGGGESKIEKYEIAENMYFHHQWPFLAPKPSQTVNPLQTVTSSIDKSHHGKNA